MLLGVGGFCAVHSSYFVKGATSIGARFDYWRAALTITRNHPAFGSGPGTFGHLYRKLKRPESEMARLTHNDYLEQASDSGLPGAMLYSALLIGSVICLYGKPDSVRSWIRFSVWLGLVGGHCRVLLNLACTSPRSHGQGSFHGLALGGGQKRSAAERSLGHKIDIDSPVGVA